MTGHKTKVPGFRISKTGKVERNPARLSVSQQLKQKPGGSKKVRVSRGRALEAAQLDLEDCIRRSHMKRGKT